MEVFMYKITATIEKEGGTPTKEGANKSEM